MSPVKYLITALCATFIYTSLHAQEGPQFYKPQGLTFIFGSGSDLAMQRISTEMDKTLKFDFPNKKANTVQAPSFIAYQYHVKKRLSLGLVYCTASVTTPELDYPDLQNPGEITRFRYQVAINSFMGNVDYHWYIRNGKKSSLSLHSGIALGVFDVNFRTQVLGGDGQNLPNVNFSSGGNGWQLTLIGVKQNFDYKLLKGFGYMANLGLGTNVIGTSFAITYTL